MKIDHTIAVDLFNNVCNCLTDEARGEVMDALAFIVEKYQDDIDAEMNDDRAYYSRTLANTIYQRIT